MSNKMMPPRIPLSYNHLQYDATGRGISMEYFKSMRLELTVKYLCIRFIVPYGLWYERGVFKMDRGNKMTPPRVPQIITIYMWGNRHGIQYGTFQQYG